MANITIKEALVKVMTATKNYIDRRLPTEEEILLIMAEEDIVQPMTDETGAVLTDADGNLFIL